jgi:predicted DNA-binding antitoxin AbrB/MazE fold protein
MSTQSFQAVFENGVLRPLEPLELAEHAVVSLAIVPEAGDTTPPSAAEVAEAKRQGQAWRTLLEELAQVPDAPDSDGLTNRDHDRILYGNPEGDLR